VRVEVNPRLITWARHRSGVEPADLRRKFPKLDEWERGESRPTLRQLEGLAKATHTPVGFLFLDQPPVEAVPIPDYRAFGDAGVEAPSADLLDTIYQCQQRQEWYRSFAQAEQDIALPFVGSLSVSTSIVAAASALREVLAFEPGARGSTFSGAFRLLAEEAEEHGILVMVSGIVGSNTRRKLDPEEFRGFALVDPLAPLVFVNGADTKAAQTFTLAHELAHIWIGETALSDADVLGEAPQNIEQWCNRVAAEFLVPIETVSRLYNPNTELTPELDRLAKWFKVSTLVILRRLYEGGFLKWDSYRKAYQAELARVLELMTGREASGGDFYNTQPVRLSKRFTRALVSSTLAGRTLYTDAFEMLGFRKLSTFNELASRLGVR